MKRREFVYQTSALATFVQLGCSGTKERRELLDSSEPSASDVGDSADSDTAQDSMPAWDDFEPPEPPGSCEETQSAMEGPYYLEDIPIRNNLDLYNEDAQKVIVYGYICDAACQPIPNAVIEVWHADSAGAYDLDSSEMKYYGQLAADETGFYRFKTILPGAYATGADDYRPKHYHIKVWVNGERRLITQLYFKDDPFLEYEPNTPESLMLEIDESSPCRVRYDFTLKD